MGLMTTLGFSLVWFGTHFDGFLVRGLLRLIGGLLIVASLLTCVASLRVLGCPRVVCTDQHLRLVLRFGAPIEVPLDVVECFFLGQGPSFVGSGEIGQAAASNVVVRLAERATEWHQREVHRSLGHWCEGYITIRGAWCEPIDGEVVGQMNAKLAAVKRARRTAAKGPVTETETGTK